MTSELRSLESSCKALLNCLLMMMAFVKFCANFVVSDLLFCVLEMMEVSRIVASS